MALAHSEAANPHWVPRKKIGDLSHIPGENGPPIIGTTFRVLRDPPGYGKHMVNTYGKVFRTNAFGNPTDLAGRRGGQRVDAVRPRQAVFQRARLGTGAQPAFSRAG